MGLLDAPSFSIPRGASLERLQYHPALRRWREQLALARQGSGIAHIQFLGDSWDEGFTVTNYLRRLPDRVRRGLQRGSETPHSLHVPFRSSGYAGGADFLTRSGAITAVTGQRGLGQWALDLAAGAYIEFSIIGTFAQIAYTKQSTAPANGLTVTLDGTVVGTLNPNTAGADASALSDIPGGAFTYGTHTVRLTNTGGAGTIRVEGCFPHDGSSTTGIVASLNAHSGYKAQDFASQTTWIEAMMVKPPDVVTCGLGYNDVLAGRTSAQLQTDLTTVLNAIDAAYTSASVAKPGILLYWRPTPSGVTGNVEPIGNFRDAMAAVALASPTTRAFLDLSNLTTGAALASGLTAGDNLHPNDAGSLWLSERLLEVLDPRPPHANAKPAARGPIELLPQQPIDGELGTWTGVVTSSAGTGTNPSGTWYRQSPAGAVVAEERWRVWLEAGTYFGFYTAFSGATCGIAQLLIDGVSAGTLDMYAAATYVNGLAFPTSITITDAGWHCVTLRKTATKNASATNYAQLWCRLSLARSA